MNKLHSSKRFYTTLALLGLTLSLAKSQSFLGFNKVELLKEQNSYSMFSKYADHTPQEPTKVGDFYSCGLCKLGMTGFDKIFASNSTEAMIEKVAEIICAKYVAMNDTVCPGAVKEMGDIIIPVISQSILSPDYFCSEFLGYCSSTNYYAFYAEQQVDELLKTKPLNIQDNSYLNNLYASIAGKQRKTLTAIQISDPHVDFSYTIGTDSLCNNYLCCRPESGFTSDPARQAGQWGSYNCDIPPTVLQNMLEFVKDEIKPDIFFWTGDNSAHDVWENSNKEVSDSVVNITQIIKGVFQDTNISVYPIQGNHDTWPVNVQDFTSPNSNVPINSFSDFWLDWLDNETLVEFEAYGYYSRTLKLRDGRIFNNTRVIGINTQACNNMNWQLLKNRFDPGQEMEWLENELKELEKLGGQAIILTHIPMYTDCVHGWGHRFRGIYERFQHIIRFGLMGHTHNEQIAVVKSIKDEKNIGINYVAGSLTTLTDKNPSFTAIEIDEEYMIPLSFKTYYYNITKANEEGKITWEMLHDFAEEYSMKDMSPDSIANFSQLLKSDEQTAILYDWNKGRQVSGQKMSSCDETCRLNQYCDVASTEYFQNQVCNGRPTYDFLHDPLNAVINLLVNPWLVKNETLAIIE